MATSHLHSGHWTGFFNHNAGGHRNRTDLTLTFTHGIVSGTGKDRVGTFGIAGCLRSDDGEIHWTKTYSDGHRVSHRGFIDGEAIWGTWEITESNKGGFHIWPALDYPRPISYRVKALRSPARSVKK